jgi:hypothetical protein
MAPTTGESPLEQVSKVAIEAARLPPARLPKVRVPPAQVSMARLPMASAPMASAPMVRLPMVLKLMRLKPTALFSVALALVFSTKAWTLRRRGRRVSARLNASAVRCGLPTPTTRAAAACERSRR